MYFDGESNDVIDSAAPFAFRNDPRIPFMYFEEGRQYNLFNPAPEVFIIGAAAQGIVKSIKFLVKDESLIDAVEINPAIVSLMKNELWDLYGYGSASVEILAWNVCIQHFKLDNIDWPKFWEYIEKNKLYFED